MRIVIFLFVNVLLGALISSCGNSKKITEQAVVQNEIIAQLKGRVKPQQVVGAYQRYKIKTVERVEEATNTWLFSFDAQLIQPAEMLHIMKNSQFVATAKFKE